MNPPKLCKKACPKCGDLNIFFDGVNKIECKNCEHVIVRNGGNIMQEKYNYEKDQDIELLIRYKGSRYMLEFYMKQEYSFI